MAAWFIRLSFRPSLLLWSTFLRYSCRRLATTEPGEFLLLPPPMPFTTPSSDDLRRTEDPALGVIFGRKVRPVSSSLRPFRLRAAARWISCWYWSIRLNHEISWLTQYHLKKVIHGNSGVTGTLLFFNCSSCLAAATVRGGLPRVHLLVLGLLSLELTKYKGIRGLRS